MKRISSIIIFLVLAFLLATPAMAAPSAEMEVTLSDVQENEDGWLFTLNIEMLAPTEPYASLDFNLVCGDHEHLAIVDNSEAGDRSALDIKFTKDYGSANHKGRINSETGAISYLIGIFSQVSGNAIKEQTHVCAVTLCYTGSEPQSLSLEKLKLVYKDASGKITSVSDFPEVSFTIDPDFLANAAITIADGEDPLANMSASNIDPLLIVAFSLVAVLAAVIVLMLLRNRKNKMAAVAQGASAAESNTTKSNTSTS